jgi:flagellin-specific chaperone FliS
MNNLEKYRNTILSTASSENQIIFVFNEMIKLLYLAKKAMSEEKTGLKFESISSIIDALNILKSSAVNQTNIVNFYNSTISQLQIFNLKSTNPEDLEPIAESLKKFRKELIKVSD